MRRLLQLDPSNFTPRSRTPWGGTKIGQLKKLADPQVIGESWEVSWGPTHPSRLRDGVRLADAMSPAELGDAAQGMTLLMKLLDAADWLSLQIHPSDDYPQLDAGQCGKPESWYVVGCTEGAKLYIGFRDGVGPDDVRARAQTGLGFEELLFPVPVEPGDFFLIQAGLAHAIGPGVTLVEPQRVLPDRDGMTYRYWDWGRRYDSEGKHSETGQPRALHLEHALAVTDWNAPREEALLQAIRRRIEVNRLDDPELTTLCGNDGQLDARTKRAGLASNDLSVGLMSGSGELCLDSSPLPLGLTVVRGTVRHGETVLQAGESAVITAGTDPLALQLTGCEAILASASP